MKLSFKLYILVTLYKINLCMSNIISLKYYFLCENELVWREFSKKIEISKKRVRAHGFTGAGVTGTGNGYGGPDMHGLFFEKPDPALLIPVPVYPCIPVARARSGPGTGTGGPVRVEPPGVFLQH